MNAEEKKVGLSLRAVGEEGQPRRRGSLQHPASSATATTHIGRYQINWKRAGNDQD